MASIESALCAIENVNDGRSAVKGILGMLITESTIQLAHMNSVSKHLDGEAKKKIITEIDQGESFLKVFHTIKDYVSETETLSMQAIALIDRVKAMELLVKEHNATIDGLRIELEESRATCQCPHEELFRVDEYIESTDTTVLNSAFEQMCTTR